MTDSKAKPEKLELAAAAVFALLALAVVLYVRLRLLGMPFERDEGEYAYSGQLILKGLPPYLHAYTMKLPGMAYLSALFMLCFGVSVQGLHLGLLVSNILSMGLIFLIGRRLSGAVAGLVAAGVFGLLTVSQHLLGVFAHATHFIVLFVLAAAYLVITGENRLSRCRYIVAGLLLGTAFLIKQHALLFLAALLLSTLLGSRSRRQKLAGGLLLLAGFITPYLLVMLVLLKQGVFITFWFWTVSYASAYATGMTPLLGWINFKSQLAEILGSTWPYWALALCGLLLLKTRERNAICFILPLLICSLLAICPGFYFRPHYFILLTPVVAILTGMTLRRDLFPPAARVAIVVTVLVAALFQVSSERWFLFVATPQQYLKKAYQTTKPFAETAAVAAYIRDITAPTERIVVFGSEPQIYFYADRLSATGHIYMYPLMEEQPYALRMQAEMLQQLSANRPACIVLVDDLSSWLSVSPEGEIFREKLGEFLKGRYELDGVASVSREGESFYVFGERSRQFLPDTASRILVYRIKQGV